MALIISICQGIDADSTQGGTQNVTDIGNNFFTFDFVAGEDIPGEVRFVPCSSGNSGFLYGNTDTDANAEFVIALTNSGTALIAAALFL